MVLMTFDDMNLEYEMNVQGKHQALKEARVNPLEEKVVDNNDPLSLDSINQSDFNVYRDQLFLEDKSKKKSETLGKSKAGKHPDSYGETSGTKVRSGKLPKKTNKPAYHYNK